MTDVATPPAVTAEALHRQHQRVREALQPRLMGPRLVGALGASEGAACHVVDAKYEPGRRAILLYRLGSRLVRGDVLPEADAGAPAGGVVVPPGVVLSCFPHDPEMPTLAAAVDADVLTRHLRASHAFAGSGLVGTRVRLLRYRPGKRATLHVRTWSRQDGRSRAGSYVAKVYHDAHKAAAVAAVAGRLDPHGAGPLALAPLVAHLAGLSVVVQGMVHGRELPGELLGPGAREATTRAAEALAALHARPAAGARPRPVAAELDRFVSRALAVAAVDPRTGGALLGLAYRLQGLRPALPAGRDGLVHGDCKPSQFLLTPERAVLLDLDHCGLGDPAADVGTFLASVRQASVRQASVRQMGVRHRRHGAGVPQPAGWADRTCAVFLDAYAGAAGGTGAAADGLRQRVRWYEAVALERKALRAFARAPGSPLPAALADEGHRRLDLVQQEHR